MIDHIQGLLEESTFQKSKIPKQNSRIRNESLYSKLITYPIPGIHSSSVYSNLSHIYVSYFNIQKMSISYNYLIFLFFLFYIVILFSYNCSDGHLGLCDLSLTVNIIVVI